TNCLTLEPSALPFTLGIKTPIILPKSRLDVALTSSIVWSIRVFNSSSVNCSGIYASKILISVFKFSTRSGRFAFSNSITESLRCFNSRERIVNSSSSDKVSTPSLIASFCKEAVSMRMTCNFSRSLSLIACFMSLVSSSDNDNYFSPTLFIYVYVQLQISFFYEHYVFDSAHVYGIQQLYRFLTRLF